jgi:membrane protein DedA with SNARE-associated domain
MPFASLTTTTTSLLEHHGVVGVFLILAVDAVLPVGGELPMILSGVLAAGAIGAGTSIFGIDLGTGLSAYVALSLAGTLGYLTGAVLGWQIGRRGGVAMIERHGHWLHLGPARLRRAERCFFRWGGMAVLLGRITPLVRSFVSVTAGVLRAPLGPYVALTAIGSAIWCFGLAGAGWALGANWDALHTAFRGIEAAVVLALLILVATMAIFGRRRSR